MQNLKAHARETELLRNEQSFSEYLEKHEITKHNMEEIDFVDAQVLIQAVHCGKLREKAFALSWSSFEADAEITDARRQAKKREKTKTKRDKAKERKKAKKSRQDSDPLEAGESQETLELKKDEPEDTAVEKQKEVQDATSDFPTLPSDQTASPSGQGRQSISTNPLPMMSAEQTHLSSHSFPSSSSSSSSIPSQSSSSSDKEGSFVGEASSKQDKMPKQRLSSVPELPSIPEETEAEAQHLEQQGESSSDNLTFEATSMEPLAQTKLTGLSEPSEDSKGMSP